MKERIRKAEEQGGLQETPRLAFRGQEEDAEVVN